MNDQPHDPKWPRLLSLSVHEFRTPITVVAGYIRMLLKERAGPLSDSQRRLLEEAEKSCARLTGLVAEMSDLSGLEAGSTTFSRSTVDLRAVLRDAVAGLPEVPDRAVSVELSAGDAAVRVQADAVRLRHAFTSLMVALRRELVDSDTLYVRSVKRDTGGQPVSWTALADREHIGGLEQADPTGLETFDEWRGGCGLSLAIARRIITAHDGRMWSAAGGSKAAAVVMIPIAQ